MLATAAREGLSAPVNVTWEVTLRCNLQCRHCLSAAGRSMAGELSTEECLSVLNELASLKVFQINIGGGEPFSPAGHVHDSSLRREARHRILREHQRFVD